LLSGIAAKVSGEVCMSCRQLFVFQFRLLCFTKKIHSINF